MAIWFSGNCYNNVRKLNNNKTKASNCYNQKPIQIGKHFY